jgi:D-beta-D-heptose 7-phosphate kinase/D-beta-D-heptose 1-phosphate adenosyltransferase
MNKSKVVDLPTAVDICRSIRSRRPMAPLQIVFTNGCFDLVHVGHLRLLERARSLGDALIVGLNSDRSVRELKGPERPIIPEAERAELLAGLAVVDYVVIFDEPTPLNLIKAIMPNVLVKGGDWTPETIVGRAEVEDAGGKVVVIPLVERYSTSGLVDKIRNLRSC